MAYLLHYIGVEAFGILCDRLDPDDPYKKTFGELCRELKEFYVPEPLEIAEIYTYRKRLQKEVSQHRSIWRPCRNSLYIVNLAII